MGEGAADQWARARVLGTREAGHHQARAGIDRGYKGMGHTATISGMDAVHIWAGGHHGMARRRMADDVGHLLGIADEWRHFAKAHRIERWRCCRGKDSDVVDHGHCWLWLWL